METTKRALRLTAMLAIALATTACGPSTEEWEAAQAQISGLQAELDQSKERNATLESRLKEVGDRNRELQERLSAAGAESGDLKSTLAEKDRALAELRAREKQAQERLQVFQGMLDQFKSMIDSGKLRVRIVRGRMVVELSENILFDSGKAELKKGGKEALTEVGSVLSSIENRDFQIAGHTDNIPIRSRKFPSNWELSTARAVTVTRFLSENGVDPSRLSAAGYAETQPVAENDTPEGRSQNRRIEIILQPNLDELPDLSGIAAE